MVQVKNIEAIGFTEQHPRNARRPLRGPKKVDPLRPGIAEQQAHAALSIVRRNQRDFVAAESEILPQAPDHMAERVKLMDEIPGPRSIHSHEPLFLKQLGQIVEANLFTLIFSAPIPKQDAALSRRERL